MSIANWNAITQYLIGDEVYDGSSQYYYAIANNQNDPPPSANWMLVVPSVAGVSSLNALTGALSLVGSGGTTITPGFPGANDITISSLAPSYASFYSTTIQPLTTGAETLVFYDGTFISTPDITLASPTQVRVANTGVYTFLYSLQTDKQPGGGTSADVEVYIKINGVAVPNSSSRTNITNAVEQLLTCDYILSLTAGQVVEVGAYTTGTNVRFPFFAPLGTAPATPSVITNIKRIA